MRYTLECANCGHRFKESKAFSFICPNNCVSLARSVYPAKRITFRNFPGIWRYHDWLPVEKITGYEGKSVTYKSSGLAKELGLENLYISFNGFWPEMSALVRTCTFKEFEAVVTLQYAKENNVKSLIVTSAGSVANAFGYVASLERFKVFLLVPEQILQDLMVPYVNEEYVKVISVKGGYSDAKTLVNKFYLSADMTFDGEGKSIARRDALGTVLLEAVEKIGKIPKHYFQAVSSGNGVVGVFNMATRLVDDGRFGNAAPMLHLSQNEPFVPIVRAWKKRTREIKENDFGVENPLNVLYAKVLSSKDPLYGIRGGVFDALQNTGGETYAITNEQATEAYKLFEAAEGIDIHPAAAIAVASLIEAVKSGNVDSQDSILLNISGGGLKRVKEEAGLQKIKLNGKVEKDASVEELRRLLNEL